MRENDRVEPEPVPSPAASDAAAAVVRVPCPEGLRERVRSIAAAAGEGVVEAIGEHLPSTAEEFAELERRLAGLGTRGLAAPVLEAVLRALNGCPEFVASAVDWAEGARPLASSGQRDVAVAFVDGGVGTVETAYATAPRPSASRPGRRRGVGRRGPSGSGLYPVLARLGFLGRPSPLLTSTVARAAAELGSYAEARESLASRGVELDLKGVRLIAHRVADAGLEARRVLEKAPETRELEGKRVVVTFDGGRLRTRVSGKGGRRREATGRRGYETPWREPALLAIYTVDEKGKKTAERPWYEATLGGWDALFGLAVDLLRRLGARHARELVIAGDGAATIWDRVDDLIGAVGIPRWRVRSFADFWHAVEHLHEAANLVRSWTDEQRARWVRARRRALHDGKVDDVVTSIRELAVGRNAKEIEREAEYFDSRRPLMRYDQLRAQGLPIGTGAVESAVRRVINLRMKGPGIFWNEPNAERLLLLRCRLKAGRWSDLERDLYAQAAARQGRALALAPAAEDEGP